MRLVLHFLGVHLIVQMLLLAVFLSAREPLLALYAWYRYSPALFFYYAGGLFVVVWLLWSGLRRYLLLASVGGKADRAARTRGFE